MNPLTDPDFDKKMKDLADFLECQRQKLLALISDGPDEHCQEIDEIRMITDKTRI